MKGRARRVAGRLGLMMVMTALVVVPLAPAASAGVIGCTGVLLGGDPVRDAGHYVNCSLDTVGNCTEVYDPLIDGNSPVFETIEYADCLA